MELWIIVMSVAAFIQMGYDKLRAVKGQWRVSEKALWLVAILGGGIGSFLGMVLFRHKIRKLQFTIGFLLFALFYLIIFLEIPRYIPQLSIR